MEEDARSDDSSEVVVKSRNASGCLIVRKAVNGMARPGVVGSSYMNKERKRHRIMGQDGGEIYGRKEVFRTNQVFSEFGNGQGEYVSMRNNFEHGEGFRKRRRSSEFSEPVEYGDGRVEGFQMDGGYNGGRSMYAEVPGRNYLAGHSPARQGEEEDDVRYRRRHSDYMAAAAAAADGDKWLNYYGDRNRYSNGFYPPGTSGNMNLTPREEYIRIQGKNGVLRVKISKVKGTSFLKAYGHLAGDVSIGSGNEDVVKRKKIVGPSAFVESKHLPREQPVVFGRADKNIPKTHTLMPSNRSRGCEVPLADIGASLKLGLWRDEDQSYSGISVKDMKNNREAEMSLLSGRNAGKRKGSNGKGKQKLQSLPTKSDTINGCDSQSDNGGVSLKLGTCSAEKHKLDEGAKSDENRVTQLEKCSLNGSKDGKQKRGSGTEKQKLRDHIRKMLLDSGWIIDYRPRRNRDYQDAVYVSPTGTAYWSIVKAYEGLQKQFAEDNRKLEPIGDGSQFSPVADDILNKLTRQTRKKMEKEMKKKGQNGEGSGNLKDNVSKKSVKAKHVARNAASNGGLHSLANEDQKPLDDSSNKNIKTDCKRASRKQSRRTLLVRTANRSLNSDDDVYVPYAGKRTLLSWLIDCGSVKLNEKVQYMNHTQTEALQQGWISRDGIHCLCCSKIVTISKFELHAGAKVHQPLQSIFLESGVSLLQCMVDAWKKKTNLERDSFHQVDVKGDDKNDDICGICGDGGDLICCDGCPSTFHQICLGVQILPPGEWHCPNCVCIHCGLAAYKNTKGSVEMCSALLACNLCDKKYHPSCITGVEFDSFRSSFCNLKCKELYEALQRFVGVKHDLGSGFSWSIIRRTDIRSDSSLADLAAQIECNCKLAVVQEIMEECFLPIVDQRSGINLIHHVVYNYGSNFNRLNYSKFCTAILERGDEIISVASLRFHGEIFAEMPFIGTRHIYRHQGMCRRLFTSIESALRSFNVKKLVIPAISELMHTWTEVFRFNRISESDKKKFRSMNILRFPGVDMLQKLLSEQNNIKTFAPCTAVKSTARDESPILLYNSNKEQSDGTGQDDSYMGVNRIQKGKTQGDASASASDSESDSDSGHARNTLNPASPLSIPPRISVIVDMEEDKETSKLEDSNIPKDTNLHNNQDPEEAADVSNGGDNAKVNNAKTTANFISGSPSSELPDRKHRSITVLSRLSEGQGCNSIATSQSLLSLYMAVLHRRTGIGIPPPSQLSST